MFVSTLHFGTWIRSHEVGLGNPPVPLGVDLLQKCNDHLTPTSTYYDWEAIDDFGSFRTRVSSEATGSRRADSSHLLNVPLSW